LTAEKKEAKPVTVAQDATLHAAVNKKSENRTSAGILVFGTGILCSAGFLKWEERV
jgi:hypothetical protein